VILGKNDLKSPLTGKGRRKLKEKKLGPAWSSEKRNGRKVWQSKQMKPENEWGFDSKFNRMTKLMNVCII
jgi:hypothetical protein